MRTVQLGDIVKISKGKKAENTTEKAPKTNVPYIQIDEVRGKSSSLFVLDNKYTEVTKNDLCIVWDGANAGTVGFGLSGAIGSTVARLRFSQPNAWDAQFIGRLLQSMFVEINKYAQSRGATIPHVDKRRLEEISLPTLPLDEQRRIAAILDKADAIRRKRQQALRESDRLEHALFLNKVGPKAEGYETWKPVTFEELAKPGKGAMRTGPFGSDLRHSEFVEKGVAVLGIDNAVHNRFAWGERRFITPEKYENLTRYTVYPGDVIVTIMGTTGRSAVVPDDIPLAITTKHLAAITADRSKAEPEFLSNALHRHPAVLSQIKKANKGAIMDGLNLGIIKSLQIPLPPIDVQHRYVADLCHIRAMQAKMKQDGLEAGSLFSSLSQRAFRGEL